MQSLQGGSRLPRRLVIVLAIAAIAAPVAQADLKTLADYPPAIAREAARSYGPVQATPIKTLTHYPSAIAREAARSYGPLPATSKRVFSQSDGFDWRDAAIDAATVLALLLVSAVALLSARHKSRRRTA